MAKAALVWVNAEISVQICYPMISRSYNFTPMNDTYQITEEAIELAGKWQKRANELRTRPERVRQRKFARLFESTGDKVILTKLIDQSFRCADNRRTADHLLCRALHKSWLEQKRFCW